MRPITATTSVLVLLSIVSARADDLVVADFEPPAYSAGVLTGQNGWIAYGQSAPNAISVGSEAALRGAQGAKLDGSLMELYSTFYGGFYYPPVNYDPVVGGEPQVQLSLDLKLVLTDPNDVFMEVQCYDLLGNFIAAVGVSSFQQTYLYNDNLEQVFTEYTPGNWVHLAALFDYDAQTIAFSADGQAIGQVAMPLGISGFGDADLTLICDVPFTSVAYVDDYAVSAGANEPEPCPGDVDGDRTVDLADLASLLSHFGATGEDVPGDLDDDGDVDLSDLATLLAHFGASCP